jgi:acyl-coenzyme A thioesterase PaaI-like protein
VNVTDAVGDLTFVPIVGEPNAVVTGVTVEANVSFIACGEPNVIEFAGSITANGPTTVSYQWEVRGDKENTTDPETLVFEESTTLAAPDPGAYKADCGEYSIRLRVLSPNQVSAAQEFSVGE